MSRRFVPMTRLSTCNRQMHEMRDGFAEEIFEI